MAKTTIALISIYVAENNGVRFLAHALRRSGFRAVEFYLKDYRHHDFRLPSEKEYELLISKLRDINPELIGISLRAGAYLKFAASLTARLKERLHIPVIWGGMHVTMSPEECIAYPDMISIGESEEVIVDIARHLEEGQPLDNIPNLWIKKQDGIIIRNPIRPLRTDLDNLLRDFHSSDKYFIDNNSIRQGDPYRNQTVYQMMSARGCLFNCSYCEISALRKVYRNKGTFYRHMTPEGVIKECQYALDNFPNLKRFRFDDELFCLDEEWVKRFAELYRRDIAKPFELLTDPRIVSEDQLRLLKMAGLDIIMMGIQNISEVNARLYNRKVSDDDVLKAAGIINRLGLKPCYQVLLDDPHLTGEDKAKLFDLLSRLPRPFDLYFFSLSYWPSTDITEKYLADGTITPDDIEGRNDKCLHQFHVDLSWPRSKEDIFWDSLFTLLSKQFLPIDFIKMLSRSSFLRRHPEPLRLFAQALNLGKLAYLALKMLLRGELTWEMIKRWVNFKSLATA